MTMEEFRVEVKTLEEFYNKELNFTQVNVWFDEMKYYSTERFKKAISKICRTQQYFPSLSSVIEVMSKGDLYKDEVRVKVPCQLCKGTGYIIYKKEIGDQVYDYACLCTCENAKGLNYNGAVADRDHRSKFYLPTAEEAFADRVY